MKMQQTSPASLWPSIIAAGNLSSRILVGHDTKATWEELVHGSIPGDRSFDLHGQSVLVATADQFRAAATLIELDGIARRVILYPPDLSREQLPYVAGTAEANVLVTDQPEIASPEIVSPEIVSMDHGDHGVDHVVLCSPTVTPVKVDRGSPIETEWILLTSGTTSDRSKNITGTVITVDAGNTA